MQNGKWGDSGVPKFGWECVGEEDLGEPLVICEMCEVQEIRYVQSMKHEAWPTTLGCGRICAGNMEGDAAAAKAREIGMRNRAARERTAARRASAADPPEWW
jgi:hypothetical protein